MMTNEESTEIVSFMAPWQGSLEPGCGHQSHMVKRHYFFKNLLLYFWGLFRQTQKDSFDDVPFDSYCINKLSLPLLIFIYSMIALLICKYEPF